MVSRGIRKSIDSSILDEPVKTVIQNIRRKHVYSEIELLRGTT